MSNSSGSEPGDTATTGVGGWSESGRRTWRPLREAQTRPTVGSKRRILVVEDDRAIREALTQLLESEGYDVHGCNDGVAALERLRAAAAPDVILLDLRLPVMDGWQ